VRGSKASRASITSAGLVWLAIDPTPLSASKGRAPMKVPRPTWRQICPSSSKVASALRREVRVTPSSSQSLRSGGKRPSAG
jgi:hypothetical protein